MSYWFGEPQGRKRGQGMTKEEAKDYIREWCPYDRQEEIIKALEQEPFMNKPCVAHQVCHEDKVKVLDKIRAEIGRMTPTYHNPDWSITNLVPISEVLKLINKCKAESEG